MNVEPTTAARIRNSFTEDAYRALRELSETRIKNALGQLVNATEESETWRLRGEINTLRLFSELEESVKNIGQSQK